MAEMVDPEGQLEAVRGLTAPPARQASVVDQPVQRLAQLAERRRAAAYRVQPGQVQREHADRWVPGGRGDGRRGRWPFPADRQARYTRAPRLASPAAVARPIPVLPPVTR